MPNDQARDIPLVAIPAYAAWSEKKLSAGESEAVIGHLDAMAMWLSPAEVQGVGEPEFEELLLEVKIELGVA